MNAFPLPYPRWGVNHTFFYNFEKNIYITPNYGKFPREQYNRLSGFIEVYSSTCLQEVSREGVLYSTVFNKRDKTIDEHIFVVNIFREMSFSLFNDIRYYAGFFVGINGEERDEIPGIAFHCKTWIESLVACHYYYLANTMDPRRSNLLKGAYCLDKVGFDITTIDLFEMGEFMGIDTKEELVIPIPHEVNQLPYAREVDQMKDYGCPFCGERRFRYDSHSNRFAAMLIEAQSIGSLLCKSAKCQNPVCRYIWLPALNFRGDSLFLKNWVTDLEHHKLYGVVSCPRLSIQYGRISAGFQLIGGPKAEDQNYEDEDEEALEDFEEDIIEP
jgi:hypothetical protein